MTSTRLRIAHIGLGDIAQKAYLPLTTAHPDIMPVLCTRSEKMLAELSRKYRIDDSFTNLDELIASRPDAAMIHTSTDSHFSVTTQLLKARIPVFVDKPVSNSLAATEEMFALARKHDVALFVGFNRRYAPLINGLRETPTPHHISWQKHRVNQPGESRTFLFDDFIHVVDSLLYLADGEPENLRVHHCKAQGLLASIQVSWTANGTLLTGSMNRVSGITEERVELFSSGQKVQIEDLNTGVQHLNGQRQELGFGNWQSTLYKRGFVAMIDDWLETARHRSFSDSAASRDLLTHRICEEILEWVMQD